MRTTYYFACIYEKAKCTTAETAEDFYRLEFFKLVDAAIVQLTERFRKRKVGLKKYQALEDILRTGVVSPITEEYPELKLKSLKIELSMFRHQNQFNSTSGSSQSNAVDEARSLGFLSNGEGAPDLAPRISCFQRRI